MQVATYCQPCGRRVTVTDPVAGGAPCPTCSATLTGLDRCEVFVSYASPDRDVARQIAAGLAKAGIRHWIDEHDIPDGKSFVDEIPRGLHEAQVVVLVLSSAIERSSWVRSEIISARNLERIILPFRIDAVALTPGWAFLLRESQVGAAVNAVTAETVGRLIAKVERELADVAARAVARGRSPALPRTAAAPRGVDPRDPPYVGPQAYTASNEQRFFGRTRETNALVEAVIRSPVVVLHAASGAGKTSLLNTTVARRLAASGYDVLLGARVGGALPESVKLADLRNVYAFSSVCSLEPTFVPSPRVSLRDYLRGRRLRPGTAARVLVFDPFEELFTHHAERHQDRAELFRDLSDALADDPQLRLVLALRQEYLADVLRLLPTLAGAGDVQQFPLRPLDAGGALEAIVHPAAEFADFAPDVAESIVDHLHMIKGRDADGAEVEWRGESVEMLHLQIVCRRLWERLPAGTTLITQADLERAVGDGQTVSAFIAGALDAFYDDTLDAIVASRQTQEHGGYAKELIRLGCMKFVTTTSTRTMVKRTPGRTGRLPDWIVDQLERHHLLRLEKRGGEQWDELAHDRLAELVGRQMSREAMTLLYAADLLEKVMDNVVAQRGGLTGYFADHDAVLRECEPFQAQPGMFADEAEFALRASLATGFQARAWSARVAADFPDIRRRVLDDALTTGTPAVRRHVATLLGHARGDVTAQRLVDLALDDADAGVRQAAVGLATLDDVDTVARLAGALGDRRTRERALRERALRERALRERALRERALRERALRERALDALARMRVAVDVADGPEGLRAPHFEAACGQLPRGDARRVRRRARRVRLYDHLPSVLFIVLPAVTLAALTAGAFKWLPGVFGYALTQDTQSAGMAIFHGLFAGVVWAGSIVFGLTLYYSACIRHCDARSSVRPLGALATGVLFGLLGSVCVDFAVIGVFRPESLVAMHWTVPACMTTLGIWHDALVTTRFGWVHMVTGAGLGLGMALTINGLRASDAWAAFLERQTRLESGRQLVTIVRGATRLVARHAWALLLPIAAAWPLAALVPALPFEVSRVHTAFQIAGDSATQAVGAFFAIAGMGLGLVIVRRGVELAPRRS